MKQYTRREVLGTIASAAVPGAAVSPPAAEQRVPPKVSTHSRPNVIIIITDDQAYGDLGCMGNPQLRTPNIDRLFNQGVPFSNHYGCPLCAPARASLLTGRYNYRTGVVDTSTGLAMMRPNETILAELLAQAGYRTAISAKWHLGDHYPLRPIDRGFYESLIAKDAIVAGIANAPANSLFNPILYHNEKPVKTQGYITDISFNFALDFIEASRGHPFFVYLPTNVVHTPLEVAPHYSDPFKAVGLDDYTSTLYGEVVNLDENVGRLQAKLQQLGIADNTIIIYTADNGPIGLHGVDNNIPDGAHRFNLGLRAGKNTVWEGGIKLPLFVYWPVTLPAGRKCEPIVSHIDVLPTVLEMCGVEMPRDRHLDGKSLLPLMKGNGAEWPERTLFFQQTRPDTAHRVYGDEPRPFVNGAARGQRYKIVMASSDAEEMYSKAIGPEETQLYDIENDPGEQNNIARAHPEIVMKLRAEYEAWFRDVSKGINPPVRNVLGSPHENPVKLTSQDLRGVRSARGPHTHEAAQLQAEKKEPLGFGYWAVEVVRDARYRITMQFELVKVLDAACPWSFPFKAGEAFLTIGEVETSRLIAEGDHSTTFEIDLTRGKHWLNATLTGQRKDGIEVSPFFVIVERLEPLNS